LCEAFLSCMTRFVIGQEKAMHSATEPIILTVHKSPHSASI